jgi:hypothetical protein
LYGWTPDQVAALPPGEAEGYVARGRARERARREREEVLLAEAVKALARVIRG